MLHKSKINIIAGLFGNALEWYDFLLYACFASLFSELFFPSYSQFASLLATFGIFAIGFLMRPIGGTILGLYADYAGRRKALIISVCLMTISTTAVAILPTYAQFGILAPILLTLCRLLQGIAVGAELPGSLTYLIEQLYTTRRGFAGSLVLSTAFLGIVCGSLTALALSTLLDATTLAAYGWRLAYILGGLLGVISIILRLKCSESQEYLEAQHANTIPWKTFIRNYQKPLLLATLYTSIMAMGNYILIAYMTMYLVKFEGIPLAQALFANLTALLFLTILIPIFGYYSDYTGRARLFLIGIIIFIASLLPIFALLTSKNLSLIICSQLLLGFTLAPLNASIPTMIAEMFATNIRASGTAISYNLGQAIFGGTIPMVALALLNYTGNSYSPAWYVGLYATVVVIVYCNWGFKKTILHD